MKNINILIDDAQHSQYFALDGMPHAILKSSSSEYFFILRIIRIKSFTHDK